MTDDLKLGLQLGYWTAQPPSGRDLIELAQQVEALGFDSIWTGESWSSDAFSPLVWAAGHTSRINLGTGIAQMSARSPVTMAMHAMTLDALSDGRFRLGIGVSGPQVVEGWYGRPFGQPLARTREYVDILRQVWRREEPVWLVLVQVECSSRPDRGRMQHGHRTTVVKPGPGHTPRSDGER